MAKRLALAAGVAAFFCLCALLIYSFTRQTETEKKLADLQNTIEQRAKEEHAQAPVATQSVEGVLLQGSTTRAANYLQKQRLIEDVIREGWKRIDERKPHAAEEAILIFKEGLNDVDPQNPDFYNGLGRAELIAGRPREALDAWQKGLAINPKYPLMESGVGWAYWNLGDPYNAKKSWEAALADDPKSADAWSAMAWIYLGLKDKEKSVKGFQILYEFNHKNPAWIQGLGMARAANYDVTQIAIFFKLPPLEMFDRPLPGSVTQPVATTSAAQ